MTGGEIINTATGDELALYSEPSDMTIIIFFVEGEVTNSQALDFVTLVRLQHRLSTLQAIADRVGKEK